MELLADFYLFDKLRNKAPRSSAEQPAENTEDPYSLGMRIEHLLDATNTQREKQIARLASRNDPRAQAGETLVFEESDMKQTLNAWRREPETWMESKSQQTVNAREPTGLSSSV